MVAGTRGNDSLFLFFVGELGEGGGGTSDFEAPDDLQILPFEIDVGFVLFGEVVGLGEGCVGDNVFVFLVGLVDFGDRDDLAFLS